MLIYKVGITVCDYNIKKASTVWKTCFCCKIVERFEAKFGTKTSGLRCIPLCESCSSYISKIYNLLSTCLREINIAVNMVYSAIRFFVTNRNIHLIQQYLYFLPFFNHWDNVNLTLPSSFTVYVALFSKRRGSSLWFIHHGRVKVMFTALLKLLCPQHDYSPLSVSVMLTFKFNKLHAVQQRVSIFHI